MEDAQTTFGGKLQTQNTLIAAPGDLAGLYNNEANYSFNKEPPDFVFKAASRSRMGPLRNFRRGGLVPHESLPLRRS